MSETNADAVRKHPKFVESTDGVFDLEGLEFEGWVRVSNGELALVQEVPTLNATVEGETVAPVVEDGWFETFERRLEDAGNVTDGDVSDPVVTRQGETVRVETRIREEPQRAADEAVAVANYVEGTWIEGIIPGYEYDERVSAIRDRARENAQGQG